jgi:hypothetical protein
VGIVNGGQKLMRFVATGIAHLAQILLWKAMFATITKERTKDD